MPDGHCARCDARWASAALNHCPSCHLAFGSVDAFDRHRKAGGCIREADFGKPFGKTQRPMLVLNDAGMYVRPVASG